MNAADTALQGVTIDTAVLTNEFLAGLKAHIIENAIQPRVVRSRSQAKRMTAKDPGGYHWKVGERYYEVVTRNPRA